MTQQKVRIGIVTVSDRASRGEYEDLGGPAIREWLGRALSTEWEAVARVVPDELDQIETAVFIGMADMAGITIDKDPDIFMRGSGQGTNDVSGFPNRHTARRGAEKDKTDVIGSQGDGFAGIGRVGDTANLNFEHG